MTYTEFQTSAITPKLNIIHSILSSESADSHYLGSFVVSVNGDKLIFKDIETSAIFHIETQDLELANITVDVFCLKIEYLLDKQISNNKDFKRKWDCLTAI